MKIKFSIVAVAFLPLWLQAQRLTLTAPNGGEMWVPGANQSIIWIYSGIPDSTRVKLVLFKDGTGPANRLGDIVQNHPIGRNGNGVYFWSVGRYEGGTAPSCNRCYYIRVITMDENNRNEGNAPFSIGTVGALPANTLANLHSSPAGSRGGLVIMNPHAGDQWRQGERHEIIWKWDRSTGDDSHYPNNVNIYLIREQYQKGHCVWVQQATIAQAAANTGSYSWRVGEFTMTPNDTSFSSRWLCYETPRSEFQFLFKISITATHPNEATGTAESELFRIVTKKEGNGGN